MANSGSRWLRWEPHIHAPGTVLNDQFKGTDTREEYLSKIEAASPQIRALGVTDHYLLDTYQEIRAAKYRDGRLPGVDLIFPNVELRLAFGTVKGNWVNCHLLVNPEDPDHVDADEIIVASAGPHSPGELPSITYQSGGAGGRRHAKARL